MLCNYIVFCNGALFLLILTKMCPCEKMALLRCLFRCLSCSCWCKTEGRVGSNNYISIGVDPKQFQDDPFGPTLNDFLVRPTFPPRANCVINDFVGIDIANCSATRQEKSRTREDKRRTRPGHRARPQSSGRTGQSVCPGLVSAARGQEEDKTQPQEPGHRVQGRGQSVWPALFFPKIEPQQ